MSEEKKVLVVGLGPVVDGEWKPRKFTKAGAERHMEKTMPADLRKHGFEATVADCEAHWRGSYAGMREGPPWRRRA